MIYLNLKVVLNYFSAVIGQPEQPKLPFVFSIIIWNLAPYLGVWFLAWEPLTVFVCYALETVVIGGFNILKLIAVCYYGKRSEDDNGPGAMGWFSIPAFALSYYLLVAIQLATFFTITNHVEPDGKEESFLYSLSLFMDTKTTYLAFGLFVAHNAYAFINEFILPQQYLLRSINQQFAEPWPRVITSQLLVFGGMMLFGLFNHNMGVLLLFTFIKIALEIFFHQRNKAEFMGWSA